MCDRIAGPSPPKRLRISELNPHLLCALCGGYLIDATTIIECLHSFCKTCILRYLETSNYCPICEVLIHKTRPWQNIRLDHSLQNAVYKMVPGLFQNEMRRRREFYEKQNTQGKDKRGRSGGQLLVEFGDRIIFTQDEEFSVSIEFSPDGKPVKEMKPKSLKRPKVNCQHDKRYLKCPAGLRIEHLKKFIRYKFSLPKTIQIDLFYESEPLSETDSLMDVAYIYMWKRDCVLRLFYSFYEVSPKVRKVEAVTFVTEKISKGKVKEKPEEKPEKRDDDKKTKSKRETPKEKKQGKITGKRKVSDDSTTASKGECTSLQVASETSRSVSGTAGKRLQLDVTSLTNSLLQPKIASTSSETADRLGFDKTPPCSAVPTGLSSTCSLASPQKSSHEFISYATFTHSNVQDLSILKSQDSKSAVKSLDKSSDLKEEFSQKSETVPEIDRKLQKTETFSEVKSLHNGESKIVSKTNLFEKINSLAKSSYLELSELTNKSHGKSSQPHKIAGSSKKLKEKDVKCDKKPNNNNNRKTKTVSKTATHLQGKVKQVNSTLLENVITERLQSNSTHSQDYAVGTYCKSKLCDSNINMEVMKNCDPAIGRQIPSESKHMFSESSITITLPVTPALKGHLAKANTDQKLAPDFRQTAKKLNQDADVSIQGIKTNETLPERTPRTDKQDNTKLAMSDIKHVVSSKQNSVKEIGSDIKKNISETKNGVKLVLNGTSVSFSESKANHVDQVVDDSKQRIADSKLNSLKKNASETKQNVVVSKQNNPISLLMLTKQDVSDDKRSTATSVSEHSNEHAHAFKQSGAKVVSLNDTKQNGCIANNPAPATIAAFEKNLIIRTSTVSKVSRGQGTTQKTENGLTGKNCSSSSEVHAEEIVATSRTAVKETMIQSGPSSGITPNVESRLETQKTVSLSNFPNQFSISTQSSDIPHPVPKSGPTVLDPASKSAIPKVKINTTSNGPSTLSSANSQLFSGSAAATVPSSVSPAPSELLKVTGVAPTTSSNCSPTSCIVIPVISIPEVKTSASSSVSPSQFSVALTSIISCDLTPLSRSEDVGPATPATIVSSSISSAITKSLPAGPLTTSVADISTTAAAGSRAESVSVSSIKEQDSTLNPPSLISEAAKPDPGLELHSTTSSVRSASPTTAASSAAASHRPYSSPISTPGTTSAPSVPLSTAALPNATLSATTTSINSWPTDTALNVVNTFLNIPLTEVSTLKESSVKCPKEPTALHQITTEEAIKLDNFLFDTKVSEASSSPASNSAHKGKESSNVARPTQKTLIKSKPNSSSPLSILVNDRSPKVGDTHITAIHQLPKTISQTSKPYSVAKSMSVSPVSSTKSSNSVVIQTTKISTLIPKSSSISSKAGTFSKAFSYPATINNVPSSRSFLHTSLLSHLPRQDLSAVINGTSGYERSMMTKSSPLSTSSLSSSSSSLHVSSAATSASNHKSPSLTKHGSKESADSKVDKNSKNRTIPPLTIPKSCLISTTLKLQRSPGSTDHYIFAPLSQYGPSTHAASGERSKSKDVKHNGHRTPTSPPTTTKDGVFIGERQRVPTIKISDINRNPIIVESGGSSISNRHHSQCRSNYSRGNSRTNASENGTHGRGRSDSLSVSSSSGSRSDRSPIRDTRRPSDSELLLSRPWHGYTAAQLLFNGFKHPTHPKFHDLHYDTDAMPLDYSQSSSKS